MVRSPLTTSSVTTSKRSSREGRKITRLIIHHTAGGTNAGNVSLLSSNLSYQVSAHYVLQTTGNLVGIVPEEYRAWTTGREADLPSVTVETVNSGGAPGWPITDVQLEMLAKLAADLSSRYGWGALNRTNVRMHREFMSTACPGPYIAARIDSIIKRANELRSGTASAPAPVPASWPFEWHTVVKGDTLTGIARKYHMSLSRLERLNPSIKDPRKLQIGARVKVAVDQVPIKPVVDGILGPETYGAWEQALGVEVNKSLGRDDVRTIQRRMNAKRRVPVQVTGTLNEETLTAICEWINSPRATWIAKLQRQLRDGTHSWATE